MKLFFSSLLALVAASELLAAGTSPSSLPEAKLGAVMAYKRTITIDLDACKQNYQTDGTVIGLCVVKLEVKDAIAHYGSAVHAFTPMKEGDTHRVAIDGLGDSYTIEYDDFGTGSTRWETAEPFIRQALQEQLGGNTYDIITFRIE